jgi:GMP synthase (glutamine-hydrolysing)
MRPALRILVIEGNERATRERIRALTGVDSSEGYRQTLLGLQPDLRVDVADPSDPHYRLPAGVRLCDYDGVAMTGSALNVYDRSPVIERQLSFVSQVFESGVAFFGSCWGLQIAVTVAGGEVRRHAVGREFGFARRIQQTALGQSHQMFRGKALVFEAPTVHVDHVTRLPERALVLAFNDHCVQAVSFPAKRSAVWGVQYHPEYSFTDIAAVARRYGDRLVSDGTFESMAELERYVRDCERLQADSHHQALIFKHGLGSALTDPAQRLAELSNWLASL